MPPKIAEHVREAGVVGAGGAGFPTHVKAASRAEVLVSDPEGVVFMASRPQWVLRSLAPLDEATREEFLNVINTQTDRLQRLIDNLLNLARIEAGAGRDGLDAVDLRHRCLELFKVVSRGGVPEVWLMGQKVLELKP